LTGFSSLSGNSLTLFISCLPGLIFIIHAFISAEKAVNAGREKDILREFSPQKNKYFPIEILFG
jgi:hypothetical protein